MCKFSIGSLVTIRRPYYWIILPYFIKCAIVKLQYLYRAEEDTISPFFVCDILKYVLDPILANKNDLIYKSYINKLI